MATMNLLDFGSREPVGNGASMAATHMFIVWPMR
jgi:hypothetical protein